MDAINLLPVKPMDAASPRDRTDAAPDQAEPGFSFESLLDERNPPTPRHPSKEAEEPGGDLPVEVPEQPAGENGAEASTLVAMLSTLPPPLPLPPLPELRATAFTGTALPDTAEAVPPAPVADVDSAVSTPGNDAASSPSGPMGAPSAAPPQKEPTVLEHKVARTAAPGVAKLPTVDAPSQPAIAEDAPAVVRATEEPPQAPPVAIREGTAIPGVEPIHNLVAVPGAAAAVVAAPLHLPVAPVAVATTGSQPRPVASPVTRRTATFNAATPAAEPRALGREAESLLVGMTEVPRDAAPFTHELAATNPAPLPPAALAGESFTRGIPPQEQRPLSPTRGSGPLPPGTVVADVPEGVEIEIAGSERDTAPALTVTGTPATARTAQAPPPPPLSPAQVSAPPPSDHQGGAAVEPQHPLAARPERAAVAPGKNPVTISVDGTSAATQERVMPDTFQPRVPEPKTAGPAANFNAAEPATPAIGARTQGDSPFQNQPDADTRQEEKSAFQQQPGEVTATAPTFANSIVTPARPTTEPVAITRTDVETIVNRTVEAVEQLRVTGHERVEVQVRLEAGQELTVRLRITNGEVQPVFLTESQDLRRAIEQNWAQFSERTADRTTRVTTPIFESPNSQSGMNDLNQRQREGRERAYSQAQAEAITAANTPRRPPVSGPTITAPAGLQLYA